MCVVDVMKCEVLREESMVVKNGGSTMEVVLNEVWN